MTTADDHVAISRRFIQQAGEELDSGDLLQASEKAWGAVAHRLKAIARQRGWRHGSHRHYGRIVDLLESEARNPDELRQLLATAESLHANFYNAFMSEIEVREGIEDVKVFLGKLEEFE